MTPKEYFNKLLDLDKEINSKINEQEKIRATKLGSSVSYNEPIFSNQFHSKTEDIALKLTENEERITEMIDEYVDMRERISKEIDQLDDYIYRIVLRERYICDKRWEEIAVEQGYVYRSITRFHGEALQEFERMFKDKFK
ncbi:MAG: hypothetical protein L0J48_01440 [Alkalibacterium sp.]|nr:hypothetical protein [Alkalibacterium sp.]